MKTFLSEVVTEIIEDNHSLSNTVCVLPSERAGVFLKQELKKQLKAFHAQRILTQASQRQLTEEEKAQLLTHLPLFLLSHWSEGTVIYI